MFCLPLSRQYHHILPIRHTHRQRSFCCRHRRKGVAAAVMAIFIAARWRKGQNTPEEVAGAVGLNCPAFPCSGAAATAGK
ncbi:hypothetical protein S83_042324 [Arachis hypogaea]